MCWITGVPNNIWTSCHVINLWASSVVRSISCALYSFFPRFSEEQTSIELFGEFLGNWASCQDSLASLGKHQKSPLPSIDTQVGSLWQRKSKTITSLCLPANWSLSISLSKSLSIRFFNHCIYSLYLPFFSKGLYSNLIEMSKPFRWRVQLYLTHLKKQIA